MSPQPLERSRWKVHASLAISATKWCESRDQRGMSCQISKISRLRLTLLKTWIIIILNEEQDVLAKAAQGKIEMPGLDWRPHAATGEWGSQSVALYFSRTPEFRLPRWSVPRIADDPRGLPLFSPKYRAFYALGTVFDPPKDLPDHHWFPPRAMVACPQPGEGRQSITLSISR